jgi:hypothetical protein
MAFADFIAGRYAEAFACAEGAVRDRPGYIFATLMAAPSAALAGRLTDAHKAVAHLQQLDPALRISNVLDMQFLRRPEDIARLFDGLQKAGLPE